MITVGGDAGLNGPQLMYDREISKDTEMPVGEKSLWRTLIWPP